MGINLSKYDKVLLKDVGLHKDIAGFYLTITYTGKCKESIDEIVFPNLRLPISPTRLPGIEIKESSALSIAPDVQAIFPFGELEAVGKDKVVVKTIENRTQKLTLAEIEKKLGYKIELVSEEVE